MTGEATEYGGAAELAVERIIAEHMLGNEPAAEPSGLASAARRASRCPGLA